MCGDTGWEEAFGVFVGIRARTKSRREDGLIPLLIKSRGGVTPLAETSPSHAHPTIIRADDASGHSDTFHSLIMTIVLTLCDGNGRGGQDKNTF